MSKKEKIKIMEPKGRFSTITYLGDRGGVGHIRCIIPNTVVGSWKYKEMMCDHIHLMNFIGYPGYYVPFIWTKFQRVCTEQHLELIKDFKSSFRAQSKTPMLYEIDDLLTEVPPTNQAHTYYEENKKYIKEILPLMDGIVVSTPYLRRKLMKYNNNISVVPNRLAKFLWGEVKKHEPVERKRPKIIYPGSYNHFSNKHAKEKGGDIGNTLIDFIKKTKKEYEWIFVGGIPEELVGDPDITRYGWIPILEYPLFMKTIEADIGIAPLIHSEFNKSKSSIKSLEYVVSGIPGIYTNIEPYKHMSKKAKTEEEMISHIKDLVKNHDKRHQTWYNDFQKVKNNLFIEGNELKWINEHLKLLKRKIV